MSPQSPIMPAQSDHAALEVRPTRLAGVVAITPPTIFRDERGVYVESYNEQLYREAGILHRFLQDDFIHSKKHVLRGFHGDNETWKLISCLQGEFLLAVVNWDPASPQYREWEMFPLREDRPQQILVPPKFGNAHLVLSDRAIFHYKQTTVYNRAGQFTVRWNDPKLKLSWPVKNPILSKRDSEAPDS